ncbi:hypothetical protein BGZ94_003619 [Podila epigama]|nr:hypothetical protein BGZ94_003619 [Podila epigama]
MESHIDNATVEAAALPVEQTTSTHANNNASQQHVTSDVTPSPIPNASATTTTTNTTVMSSQNQDPPTVALVESPPVLTETMLSSFSSDRSSSSAFGGGLLSTGISTFSTSTSASRRSSMQFSRHVEVKETLDASLTENAEGDKQLKQYVLKRVIGQGAFGRVHLAEDENTKICYAAKEFSKAKLRKKDKANLFRLGPRGRGRGRRGPEAPSPTSELSPLDLIRGEIAILKKLNHINIVKLYEVLDVASDDSMYMIFEFCERGALMPVSLTETYDEVFSDDECRNVFQQIVLGIEYLHEHDIIHRDIKPDNLLRSQDGTVKIVDFGVSEMFDKKGHDMTNKSAGSPAFMAPELCRPDHGQVSGRATDIWSMGVTLYCLRYGRLPFVSSNIIDLNRIIRENDFDLPGEQDPRFIALMHRLLEKDPSKRITIDELRDDPWLTNDGNEPLLSKDENTKNAVTEVTEEDLRGAIQKINGLVTVFKAIARFKRGIKTPSSKSSTSSSKDKDKDLSMTAAAVSLEERMQDADESGSAKSRKVEPAAIDAEVNVEVKVATKEPIGVEEQKEVMTEAEELMANKIDDALNRATLVAEQGQPEQGQPVSASQQVGEDKQGGHAEKDTEVETEKQDVTDAKEENEAPRGYEVCDMETGMCYWVPADKIKTEEKAQDADTPADMDGKSPTTDERQTNVNAESMNSEAVKTMNTTSTDTVALVGRHNESEQAKAGQPTTVEIKIAGEEAVAGSTEKVSNPANKSSLLPETGSVIAQEKKTVDEGFKPMPSIDAHAPSSTVVSSAEVVAMAKADADSNMSSSSIAPAVSAPSPSYPSPRHDSGNGQSQATQGAPQTDSGSSSPSRSLTPGPRLVGKLSRDRLAMFERS